MDSIFGHKSICTRKRPVQQGPQPVLNGFEKVVQNGFVGVPAQSRQVLPVTLMVGKLPSENPLNPFFAEY